VWDYAAVGIEDIVKVQQQVDTQTEYQRKIGYALAKDIDTNLAALVSGFSQTQGTLGTLFTDDHVRRGVQYLDDADAPEDGRVLIMAPAEKNDKLALDRWSNALYRGGTAGQQVSRGQIGSEIYGLTPFVTTNTKAQAGGQSDNTVMHKEAVALVVQREPKFHMFYDIDLFAWKLASEVIFGSAEMRDAFGVWVKGQR